MKKIALLLTIGLVGVLSSCDFSFRPPVVSSAQSSSASTTPTSVEFASVPSVSISIEEEGDGYYRPATVNEQVDFQILGNHDGDHLLKSTGTPKLLVLPIEFTGHSFSASRLADIETAIAGTADETNYWQSLKSYYKTSSFGALDMEFEFADPYRINYTPQAWVSHYRNQTFTSNELEIAYGDYPEAMPQLALEGAVKQYKDRGGDTSQFDNDGDGVIDACLMIYACKDKKKDISFSTSSYGDLFWAYQFSDMRDISPNVESPDAIRYFWASYDFFYEGIREGSGVDCHTLIHELGHILGADDYYNYGSGRDDKAEPSGGLMMMSHNIGDHDPFTKLSYSWVRPYVVTGDCTLVLRPGESSGDCVLLADHWNGTAFDEYVILELYTPTGLNWLDADTTYASTRMFTKAGVRMYHVDARLAYGEDWDSNDRFMGEGYLSDEETADFTATSQRYIKAGKYILPAATNSATYDATFIQGKGYELIQIIQANKVNSTRRGNFSTNADLFQTGDSFDLASYSVFFPEGSTLNNGEALPYSISFDQVNSESATLTFKKTA